MLAVRLPDDIERLEDIYLSIDRLEKPAKRWTLEQLENDIDMEG